MMTDIEIAQSCQMQPITAIAEKAGIQQEGVSPLLLPKYARHER